MALYIQDLFSVRPSFWEAADEPPPLPPRYEEENRLPWETRAQTAINESDVASLDDDGLMGLGLEDTVEGPQLTRPKRQTHAEAKVPTPSVEPETFAEHIQPPRLKDTP